MDIPNIPTGQFRQFGPFGVVYQVGEHVKYDEEEGWIVEITVVETGEVLDYPLDDLLEDPIVR